MGFRDRVADYFQWGRPERPYQCLQCDVYLDVEYYICPKCGSFSVDRRSADLATA